MGAPVRKDEDGAGETNCVATAVGLSGAVCKVLAMLRYQGEQYSGGSGRQCSQSSAAHQSTVAKRHAAIDCTALVSEDQCRAVNYCASCCHCRLVRLQGRVIGLFAGVGWDSTAVAEFADEAYSYFDSTAELIGAKPGRLSVRSSDEWYFIIIDLFLLHAADLVYPDRCALRVSV